MRTTRGRSGMRGIAGDRVLVERTAAIADCSPDISVLRNIEATETAPSR